VDYQPYIVGIAGGSASGKTSFLRELKENMPKGSVCIISQDNYYKPIEQQERDANGEINFDLPEAINRVQFYRDLINIRKGEEITIKEYTFNKKDKAPGYLKVKPAPIIVMEGLFIFHYEEIRKALDLRVFIDARENVMLARRIKRDADERGYDEADVRYRWENHVTPSYKQFLKPYRDDCHVIITNNSHYKKGLAVLLNHLRAELPDAFSKRYIVEKLPATNAAEKAV
jgi:uridine kinase